MSRRPPKRPADSVAAATRPQTAWLTSRWAVVLGLFVVLVVKIVALAQLADHPLLQPRGVLDDAVYVKLAQRVAGGRHRARDPTSTSSRPSTPTSSARSSGSADPIVAARTVQCLLGVAAVFLIGDTARRLVRRASRLDRGSRGGADRPVHVQRDPAAAVVGGSVPVRPGAVGADPSPSAGQASRRRLGGAGVVGGRQPRARRDRLGPGLASFLAGTAFGLLVINRPNALAAVVLARDGLAGAPPVADAVVQLAALALGLALVVAPVTVRNRVVAGEWALITSHGGLNFYIGNHAGANGTWTEVPGVAPSIEGQRRDVGRVASEALGRTASAAEASDYYYGLGWKWIREQPVPAARLWTRKLALTFNATDLALNYSFTYYARDESTILEALVVGPWLLVPLGLAGLGFGLVRPQRPDLRAAFAAWAAFVPGYAASLVVFFVASRYRLPLLVALCGGTGALVDRTVSLVKGGRWRALAPIAIAVASLSAVAWLPLEPDTGRQFERGERIVQLIADGHGEEAARLLAETEARHPQRALLLYRAGRAWQERGEGEKALPLLERALAADPESMDIGFSLAEACRDAGRAQEALRAMEGVIRSNDADPGDVLRFAAESLARGDHAGAGRVAMLASAKWPESSTARDILGMALMLQDRRTEGEAALREAVRLDPSSAAAHYHLAQAVAMAGRNDEARRLLEETLRLKPDYPEAQQLLARLK